MPPRAPLTVPTTAPLPSSLRLPPSHPSVSKPLLKLSRPSLLSLVAEWLRTSNQSTCGPFLGEQDNNDESIYETAQTLEELREVYEELSSRKGAKREVLDRVLEGDWRHGLSLKQLAMLDVQHLLDHPTSVKWTAVKLVKVVGSTEDSGYDTATPDAEDELPRFHGPTFLGNLQNEIGTLMKTHYHFSHMGAVGVTLLRIYVLESPYNNQSSLSLPRAEQSAKSLLVAFPDNSPFVYISATAQSRSSAAGSKNLRKLVIDAIPKAFSRPKERWAFKSTALTAKSLDALTAMRGGRNTNAAGGGWSVFAAGSVEESPLKASMGIENEFEEGQGEVANQESTRNIPGRPRKRLSDGNDVEHESELPVTKKRKLLAQRRFGNSAIPGDGKGIERLEIRLKDSFPTAARRSRPTTASANSPGEEAEGNNDRSPNPVFVNGSEENDVDKGAGNDSWKPQIEIKFHGSHVFAGIRQLVECGVVDGERMPGWMTGEENVSVGVIRNGRIKGHKGAGA